MEYQSPSILAKYLFQAKNGKLVNNINDAFIEMLQRLQIALVQVKLGNTSEKLVNEIRKIIFSLHWAKWIIKKVYNNIVSSI